MLRVAVGVLVMAGAMGAWGQYAPAQAEWNRAIEPFRIVGNVYYVGASGVSAYLITTPAGHILVETGFRETAPIVEASIQKLGFRVADVRMILVGHGHYDHVGGVAELKARSGAKVVASAAEAPLLARGGKGDFALADRYAYPPVQVDRVVGDGEEIRLGGSVVTAHLTPGHTKGCTSWTAPIREGGKVLRVVFPCSVSAPGYQLVNNPEYPEIQRDYAKTIAKLRSLPCDVFLSQHGWDIELEEKLKAKAAEPGRNPFIDPEGYRRYLDRGEAAIRETVEKQSRR
jgi:metallo-beta-lactamase class B